MNLAGDRSDRHGFPVHFFINGQVYLFDFWKTEVIYLGSREPQKNGWTEVFQMPEQLVMLTATLGDRTLCWKFDRNYKISSYYDQEHDEHWVTFVPGEPRKLCAALVEEREDFRFEWRMTMGMKRPYIMSNYISGATS